MGTDALRLDTLERPYRTRSRLMSSSWFDNGRSDRASLQDSSLCVRRVKSYSVVSLVRGRTLRSSVPTGLVSVRPSCQKLQHRLGWFGDGRTDRASLQDTSLCVRCVKGYSVVVLTGTDAQIERPYRTRSRLMSSSWFDNGRPPARYSRASLQDSVTAIFSFRKYCCPMK